MNKLLSTILILFATVVSAASTWVGAVIAYVIISWNWDFPWWKDTIILLGFCLVWHWGGFFLSMILAGVAMSLEEEEEETSTALPSQKKEDTEKVCANYEEPTPEVPYPHIVTTHTSKYMPSGKQVRPWVRYWARMLDILVFAFLAGIVLAFVYKPAIEMPDILFGIVFLFAYIFVEAAMLASWGTTPGKSALKVRLRNSDGSKLSYADALSRAFNVWFRGLGFGIPIVTIFTQIYAYDRLKNQGFTSWDEDRNFKVSHQTIGLWRIMAAVLTIIAALFITSDIMDTKKPAPPDDTEQPRANFGRGCDVNTNGVGSLSYTSLHKASEAGQTETVKLLLEHGADVNALDATLRSPLFYAARKGHNEIVKILLRKGANANARDWSGYTPLREAAKAGHAGTVRLLLANGVDVNAKNDDGKTALTWAVFYGHKEASRALLSAGADANIKTYASPLNNAACLGYVDLVLMLLEHGANINAISQEGYSPLGGAIKMRDSRRGKRMKDAYNSVISLLRNRGAKDIRPTSPPKNGIVNEVKKQATKRFARSVKSTEAQQKTTDIAKSILQTLAQNRHRDAEGGDPDAMFGLGEMYRKGLGVPQNYRKSLSWYRKAAEGKHAKAMFNLGLIYQLGSESGYGVLQDYHQAEHWYQMAAKRGHARAMCSLGLLYDKGLGVSQNYSKALSWYCKSAERGYTKAMNNIGVMYHEGLGVQQSYCQAMFWYRKAAETGSVNAMYNLGQMYDEGRGVAQNSREAMIWYRKAAEKGHAKARDKYVSLRNRVVEGGN